MTAVEALGSVDKLADGADGSVDAATGAASSPYRKSRLGGALLRSEAAVSTNNVSLPRVVAKCWLTELATLCRPSPVAFTGQSS